MFTMVGTVDLSAVKFEKMATPTASDSDQDIYSSTNSPIPSVIERLGQLRPSKELLDYYRKKISEFDDEHEHMVEKLEGYKCTYEEQV